jgi:UDP-N-acetylmuramoyl-tripeptide--D-alanyl-D-alanine ligase
MEQRMMDLAAAAASARGRYVGDNVRFTRVATDTRTLQPGDLFVALRGERFDGHDFVSDALASGAVAAMVAGDRAAALHGNLVVVDDPLAGLARLAAAWRARFTLPLVVVVGSNGKTTVKEMTAAALAAHFGDEAVLATRGNLNNPIGLPLTLLRLDERHRAAVIELGMNHRGETAELAPLARPTIVTVNNAQREHQEFMASVAEVAAEHADAIAALQPGGVAVVIADDSHAHIWLEAAARAGARVSSFGTAADADVRGDLELHADRTLVRASTPSGDVHFTLAAPGRPMAQNALAAIAGALAAGAALPAIARGLERFRPVAGRLARATGTHGEAIIDDSYNANPDSVRAAIDVLARSGGKRWLALGDMGEVGSQGAEFHREIGAYARDSGVQRMYAAGKLTADAVAAFGAGARHFDDVNELARALAAEVNSEVTVLVKGSRFMRMERVVAALVGSADASGAR